MQPNNTVGRRSLILSHIPVLAEVGDKIPRLPVLFVWCAGISLLAWALGRKKKWFSLLALPLAGLYAMAVTAEPLDRFVGPAIVREFGYYYPITCFAFAAIPFAVIARAFIAEASNQSPEPTSPFGRRGSS